MFTQIRRFSLHYLEMVVAMLVGMMVLWPVWMLATSGAADTHWLRSAEVESLVMATTMAVPMAAWMRLRGHAWAPTLEMSAAMYAGFVLAMPFHWAGAIGEHGLMMVGHVGMFVLMLVAMAWRWEEYAGCHSRHGAAVAAAESDPRGTTIAAS
ncbi:hypothetical protein HNR19_001650 [Nocardioides thalensis]|uniref:Flagellar biosynthetic protein FliP n=1 Tax=Nocardioides thalensis TaxID=1914755 RepID=A0A853C2N9_9ACTN|nr:hypothetical protein [Nocardioides thalensis]NYJ00952.1 hypothetical protein [Nocardioides thalensis]